MKTIYVHARGIREEPFRFNGEENRFGDFAIIVG